MVSALPSPHDFEQALLAIGLVLALWAAVAASVVVVLAELIGLRAIARWEWRRRRRRRLLAVEVRVTVRGRTVPPPRRPGSLLTSEERVAMAVACDRADAMSDAIADEFDAPVRGRDFVPPLYRMRRVYARGAVSPGQAFAAYAPRRGLTVEDAADEYREQFGSIWGYVLSRAVREYVECDLIGGVSDGGG